MKKGILKVNARIINVSLFCLLMLLCPSCFEPQEGCLDVQATNFDVEADIDCCEVNDDCCCSYPDLILSVDHKLEKDSSESFQLGTAIAVEPNLDHFFIVEDIKFYFTNLHLVNSSTGVEVGVENTIDLTVFDDLGELNTITVEDNFTIIQRNQFDYTIGEFRSSGTFDIIKFDIGVDGLPNHTLTDNLNADHALAIQEDSLQINPIEGYIFNKVNLRSDTLSNSVICQLNVLNLSPIQISLNSPITVASGFDISINLRINHLEWYKGINFDVDTKSQIEEKIAQNTTNVFEIVE